MAKKLSLSYAITVKDELNEIKHLVSYLERNIEYEDEIVILLDGINGDREVLNYLKSLDETTHPNVRWSVYNTSEPFDFSKLKNTLTDLCRGDYIFNIDADEYPQLALLQNLDEILENDVDVYRIPRINTVKGITPEHIKKWGWSLNEKEWINYPDYQMRLYRRSPNIRWINKVHEVLTGYITIADLPAVEYLSLLHEKTIKRQESQNNLYQTMA